MHRRTLRLQRLPRPTSYSHSPSTPFPPPKFSTALKSKSKFHLESVSDPHISIDLSHLSKYISKENGASRTRQLFVETPKLEDCNSSTAFEEEPFQSLESSSITDPEFYTYVLNFLLRESHFRQPHHLCDGPRQGKAQTLGETKTLHAQIVKNGFPLSGNLGNALVDLYSKCGNLGLTLKTFNQLEKQEVTAWNSILSAYSRHGMHEEAVHFFGSMWGSNSQPNQFTYAIALSASARLVDLTFGKQLHCSIIKMGMESNSFCEGSLIDFYAKCNYVIEARKVFDKVRNADIISWTAIIAGYVRIGSSEEALQLFWEMEEQGGKPDQVMSVTAITACVSLGRLQEARELFYQMQNPSVVAWNVMISGHAQNGYEIESLYFFQEMQQSGVKPTRSTLGSILTTIANFTALNMGRLVHSKAIKLGLESNVFVGSSLINMYSKCGVLDEARKVFCMLEEKNIVLWNSMLSGLAHNGFLDEVWDLFLKMKGLGFLPDEFTYVSVLSACGLSENLDLGEQLHSSIVKNNLEASVFVGNALVDMYAKSGDLEDARRQFELIQDRDSISWNSIVVGYVHNEDEEEAIIMFRRMISEKKSPDEVSLATIFNACANLQAIKLGQQVHCFSLKSSFELNLYVSSSLVDMYAKCGVIESAYKAFVQMPGKSVVSINALIVGYVHNNMGDEALNLFLEMQAEGLKPSQFTFASIMPLCSGPSGLNMGRQVHGYTLKSGLLFKDVCLLVSLIGMYMKSLGKEDAKKLFWEIQLDNNTVSWTAIISGHSQTNYSEEALSLFREMRYYGAMPDQATFASVLSSCANLASLWDGKEIHSIITKMGFGCDEYTGSALIDMYSKCGEVTDSLKVFNELCNKGDIISWNSMIVGFAKNGFAKDALLKFYEMQKKQVKPDEITFLGVLSACSHAGLVSQGRGFFEFMKWKYAIWPRADHYACIVDLLSRGGSLKEAEVFIKNLPFDPDSVIWATMLSACRIHRDDERGKWAAEKLIELEPQKSSPYVLLSNIYAASGNWEGVNSMRRAMTERGVRKLPGCSWIVVKKKTNLFVAGDKFHPMGIAIYAALKELTEVIKDDGYVSRLDLVLEEDD